ncbi:MAG: diacylglycerol kinase [bacterium]
MNQISFKNIAESFNNAIEGVIYVVKTQRNMRVHFGMAVIVLVGCLLLGVSRMELALVSLTVVSVLALEMANTALELLVDLVTEAYHPIARIVKDIAAGAVLLVSVNAIFIGYLIFGDKINPRLQWGITKVHQVPAHVTFIALVIVVILVLIGKAVFGRGRPLMGGMPSGHSALSFSIWTISVFLTKNTLVAILVFILAYWVAQSRFKSGTHSLIEVVSGGIVGILSTAAVFQFFF